MTFKVRISDEQKKKLQKVQNKMGFASLSQAARWLMFGKGKDLVVKRNILKKKKKEI